MRWFAGLSAVFCEEKNSNGASAVVSPNPVRVVVDNSGGGARLRLTQSSNPRYIEGLFVILIIDPPTTEDLFSISYFSADDDEKLSTIVGGVVL